jgi:DNA-binding SARP family transcriptional activator/TolB-like protein
MHRLTTFGAIDLRNEQGQPVREILSQPKRVALLVYLAVEGTQRAVPRERLLAVFWPEADEENARNALSQGLYHLRQALGAAAIGGGKGSALEVSPEALWCDAAAWESALAQQDVERALDLQRGEFCSALTLPGAPDFEEWASVTRRDQRRRLLAMARGAVDRAVRSGEVQAAARIARRVIPLMPDDEREVRTYLGVLEQAGDVTGALRAYAEYEERLHVVLETQPAAETRALAEAIRARRGMRQTVMTITPADVTEDSPVAVAGEPAQPQAQIEMVHATTETSAGARHAALASRRRPLVVGVALVVVLLGAMVANRMRGTAAGRPLPAGTPDAIAIFPFTARGGEASQLIGDGMPDLLAVKLDGTTSVQAIDPRSSVAATAGGSVDAVRGDALARSLGARFFVLGTVAQVSGAVEVDGRLYEVGRDEHPVVTASVRGDTTALFRVIEDVAGRLLAGVHDDRDTTLARLAAVTTPSLPALKAYLRGERALRAGLDAQASSAFREAIQFDSTFALALYRLAVTSTWVTIPGVDDPTAWAASAARHASKLTPLGRDLLNAYRSYRNVDPRSEDRYRAITQSHPDNVEAWFMLGETLFHYAPFSGRSPLAARAAFERVVTLDPGHSHALLHLARLAAMEGRAGALDTLASRYTERDAEPSRSLEVRALQAWVRQDSVAGASVAREAAQADAPLAISLAIAATHFAANVDAARPIIAQLVQPGRAPSVARTARVMLTDFDVVAGRIGGGRPAQLPADANLDWRLESEALLAAEPALGLPRSYVAEVRDRLAARQSYHAFLWGITESGSDVSAIMRLHLLARLSERVGDEAGARRYADMRRAAVTSATTTLAALLDATEHADVVRASGRPLETMAALDRLPFTTDFGLPVRVREGARFMYAESLVALKRDVEALPWYESFSGPYDTPFLAIAQLREAQIHERAGRRARAAECYRRALRYWRDASAAFAPLVGAARGGLARVQ